MEIPMESSKVRKVVDVPVTTVLEEPKEPTKASDEASSEVKTSNDRDIELGKIHVEKTASHIKAWEENEKAKTLNKYQRVLSKTNAWENTKKANAEAKLRKAEEKLEKKKAAYVERMNNEIATIHKQAEDKRAVAEAKKAKSLLNAEEMAAKYKAEGIIPKKNMCFGG